MPNLVFLVTMQDHLITWIRACERRTQHPPTTKRKMQKKTMKETEILILVLLSARMVGDFIFISN